MTANMNATSGADAGLVVDSVSVDIDAVRIVENVSFCVPTGSTIAIVGPSGVGKSTLLRVIAGILRPSSGTVSISGVDVTRVPAHRRKVAMVFQDDQLFAHLSVADNIAFGLDVRRPLWARVFTTPTKRREARQRRSRRVADMLSLVGLTGFDDRRPMSLSGGESKRVALARALAPSPEVLLLDEPLTGLDRDLHDRLMSDLRDILDSMGTTTVLVTHDIAEAEFLARDIVHVRSPLNRPMDHD